jgi:hypothetical protein
MRMNFAVLLGILLALFAMPVAAGAYTIGKPSPSFSTWFKEASERQAKEASERQAKEAEEQQAHENTERQAHEKEVKEKSAEEQKAAEERSQREAVESRRKEESERTEAERAKAEEAGRKAKEGAASRCVVPLLKGDSLGGARKALHKSHCKLGKVITPRGGSSTLIVIGQSFKRGTRLRGGTSVGVTLGPARAAGAAEASLA